VKPSPGIPRTLSFSEGNNLEQLGRIMPREREIMPCSIIHHTLSVILGRAKHEPGTPYSQDDALIFAGRHACATPRFVVMASGLALWAPWTTGDQFPLSRRHSERSEAIQNRIVALDCFGAYAPRHDDSS
jgi:hypothetical protein